MPDELEITYYRQVEDLFSTLRGVPHTLSPKDFQLLRGWWRDEVPLTAVAAGITEVFARRRGDESDPVVSLSYCRHAVNRHAKRLAEMTVGESPPDVATEGPSVADRLALVISELSTAAGAARESLPGVADVIEGIAHQMVRCDQMPMAVVEDHLFSLETVLLDGCWRAMPESERLEITARANATAETSGAEGEIADRTRRAMRDRELRRRLGLPRLELT